MYRIKSVVCLSYVCLSYVCLCLSYVYRKEVLLHMPRCTGHAPSRSLPTALPPPPAALTVQAPETEEAEANEKAQDDDHDPVRERDLLRERDQERETDPESERDEARVPPSLAILSHHHHKRRVPQVAGGSDRHEVEVEGKRLGMRLRRASETHSPPRLPQAVPVTPAKVSKV